jgi:hypothetical protein
MTGLTRNIMLTATAGLLLTGCAAAQDPAPATPDPATPSSARPTPSRSPSPAPTAVAPDAVADSPPKCTSADVQGAFSAPEGAMGTRGVRIIVTNTSSRACTIYGYGGLEMFADADGRPVHIVLNRVSDPGPSVVVLQPGGKANKSLTWRPPGAAAEGMPADCTPPVGFAGVILPDDTRAFTVEGDLGEICENREVDGRAYAAGAR